MRCHTLIIAWFDHNCLFVLSASVSLSGESLKKKVVMSKTFWAKGWISRWISKRRISIQQRIFTISIFQSHDYMSKYFSDRVE